MEQRVHQVQNLRRQGGREKHGLLLLRQELNDLADIVDKAHIQHPVGLVQDEDLHLRQVQEPLPG